MEPEGSLPHSQVPATGPYPKPGRSSPHPHIPIVRFPSLKSYQSISPGSRLVYTFRNSILCYGEALSTSRLPPPQAERPPLFRRPPLLIQYIRSYKPSLVTFYNVILPCKLKYKIALFLQTARIRPSQLTDHLQSCLGPYSVWYSF